MHPCLPLPHVLVCLNVTVLPSPNMTKTEFSISLFTVTLFQLSCLLRTSCPAHLGLKLRQLFDEFPSSSLAASHSPSPISVLGSCGCWILKNGTCLEFVPFLYSPSSSLHLALIFLVIDVFETLLSSVPVSAHHGPIDLTQHCIRKVALIFKNLRAPCVSPTLSLNSNPVIILLNIAW